MNDLHFKPRFLCLLFKFGSAAFKNVTVNGCDRGNCRIVW